MFKKGLLVGCCTLLLACTYHSSEITPNLNTTSNHVKKHDISSKKTQSNKVLRYLCKDNKEITITKNIKNEKTKLRTIMLTFQGSSQKLTQNISEAGKNYTNIHWHWYERNNYSILSTSIGKILAEQCVPQQ